MEYLSTNHFQGLLVCVAFVNFMLPLLFAETFGNGNETHRREFSERMNNGG